MVLVVLVTALIAARSGAGEHRRAQASTMMSTIVALSVPMSSNVACHDVDILVDTQATNDTPVDLDSPFSASSSPCVHYILTRRRSEHVVAGIATHEGRPSECRSRTCSPYLDMSRNHNADLGNVLFSQHAQSVRVST